MRRGRGIPWLLVLLCVAGRADAAERQPHIGYVYPAGGRQGTSFELRIGGEDVYGSTSALVSGEGVTARVIDSERPLAGKADKPKKKPGQAAIAEVVTLAITIAKDAELGEREICLATPTGVSNKLFFHVGQLREVLEAEPNNRRPTAFRLPPLPVVVNGQILPGDVDQFRFSAERGQHLVIEADARALIPYLADAVPGWFQPLLTLYDAEGKELECVDHFKFNQDPVLLFDVPEGGDYFLAIRDSLYRGREDFVYRVRIGELPFITSVFPLGGRRGGKPVTVKLLGKNLPASSTSVELNRDADTAAARFLSVVKGGLVSNRVAFAIGDLPEVLANASSEGKGQKVTPPVVINGCIRSPGERESFRFKGTAGQAISIEVRARRLGSPLDSYVVLLARHGKKIAENDDVKDAAEGLLTHEADSRLLCTLPEDGIYTVRIFDTQGKGGEDYAYRLRVSAPIPDFDLRVTPAALSLPKGGTVTLTVHAIRRDGFNGEIRLSLDERLTPCLSLDGAVIPEGADVARVTVTASRDTPAGTLVAGLRGTASVDGKTVSHPAVAAEDLMQAFLYRHLVPFSEETLIVTERETPFAVSPRISAGRLSLSPGTEVSFQVNATRSPGYDGPIRLQLVDPPKGITLRKGNIPPGRGTAFVTIRADRDAVAAQRQNLIFRGFMPLSARERASVSVPAVPLRIAEHP